MQQDLLTRSSGSRKTEQKTSDKSTDPKKQWQKPRLKDVSAEIMAQPYIRFT